MTTHHQRMGLTGTGLDPERGRPRARSGSPNAGRFAERFWDKVEKTDGCWLWKGWSAGPRAAGDDWTSWENLYAHVYDGLIEAPDLFDDAAERFRDPFTTFDKWFLRIMAVALVLVIFAAIAGWLH